VEYRVFSKLHEVSDDRELTYVIMSDDLVFEEFVKSELEVLVNFLDIIGYDSIYGVSCRVVLGKVPASGVRGDGFLLKIPDTNYLDYGRVFLQKDLERLEHQGYRIFDDNLFDPKLAMRYGIQALVTNEGTLLYLDARNRKSLVLGDFCTELGAICLRKCSTELVIDSRIRYIDASFRYIAGSNVKIVTQGELQPEVNRTLTWLSDCGDIVLCREESVCSG